MGATISKIKHCLVDPKSSKHKLKIYCSNYLVIYNIIYHLRLKNLFNDSISLHFYLKYSTLIVYSIKNKFLQMLITSLYLAIDKLVKID